MIEGKVYRIIDHTNGSFYIGSTVKDLKTRLQGHETSARSSAEGYGLASKPIIQNGDYSIQLIEVCDCEDRKGLLEREQHYMDFYPRCINRNRACLMPQVKRELDKQRYERNKPTILEKKRQYDKRYIECPCGGGYSMSHRSRHLSSQKCKNFHLNNNLEQCYICHRS